MAYNVTQFRRHLGDSTAIMAVVKSNAYGHGLVSCAEVFLEAGAEWLGVDSIDEAVTLRRSGIACPILIMGYTETVRLAELIRYNLSQMVDDAEFASVLAKKSPHDTLRVHIKVDTGMSRAGIDPLRAMRLVRHLVHRPNILIEGIMTHLSDADNHDRAFTSRQLASFMTFVEYSKKYVPSSLVHAFATAGTLTHSAHMDMVRLGIGLYGLWPSRAFRNRMQNNIELRPALQWKASVMQVKTVSAGSFIGYGITEAVDRDTTIALLPVGYYHGYDRLFSSIGEVLIGGRRCKVLGRVSMGITVVDVTDCPTRVRKGSEAVLIGKQKNERITGEELAERINTISYEITARINHAIPRIAV